MPSPKQACFLALVLLIIDQWSKWWARSNLSVSQIVDLLPFLGLVLAYNTGAAFSFLADQGGWQRWFFIALAAGVSIYLVYWLFNEKSGLLRLAIALILTGAVGNNLFDRLIDGKVTDFILLHYGSFYWPVFNVADMAICIGGAILVWTSFWKQPA